MYDIKAYRYVTCPVGQGIDVLGQDNLWYIYCHGTAETLARHEAELEDAGIPSRQALDVSGNDDPEAAVGHWSAR